MNWVPLNFKEVPAFVDQFHWAKPEVKDYYTPGLSAGKMGLHD